MEWDAETAIEDVTGRIDAIIEKLLAAEGVLQPPVDAVRLAKALSATPRTRISQRAGKNHAKIIERNVPAREREQWTAASAIGDFLKPELIKSLSIIHSGRVPMAASLSNLLACRLLTPTIWFADDASQLRHDVADLKNRYRTASHEVIAWRLLDLPQPCVISIVDNDHVHRRKSNAWPVHRELSPAEIECRDYVNYYSRPHVMNADGWRIWGWPVHLADWKREILRSVKDQEFSF